MKTRTQVVSAATQRITRKEVAAKLPDWIESMNAASRKAYLKQHPDSKYAAQLQQAMGSGDKVADRHNETIKQAAAEAKVVRAQIKSLKEQLPDPIETRADKAKTTRINKKIAGLMTTLQEHKATALKAKTLLEKRQAKKAEPAPTTKAQDEVKELEDKVKTLKTRSDAARRTAGGRNPHAGAGSDVGHSTKLLNDAENKLAAKQGELRKSAFEAAPKVKPVLPKRSKKFDGSDSDLSDLAAAIKKVSGADVDNEDMKNYFFMQKRSGEGAEKVKEALKKVLGEKTFKHYDNTGPSGPLSAMLYKLGFRSSSKGGTEGTLELDRDLDAVTQTSDSAKPKQEYEPDAKSVSDAKADIAHFLKELDAARTRLVRATGKEVQKTKNDIADIEEKLSAARDKLVSLMQGPRRR